MAILSQTGQSSTEITITCSGMDSSHQYTRNFWWQLYTDSSATDLVQEGGNSTEPYASEVSYTFTSLTPDSTYYVLCGIYNENGISEDNLLALLSLDDVFTERETQTLSATVSFDANGGSDAPSSVTNTISSTSEYDYVSITFPDNVPTFDGHEFVSWKIGITQYYPGDTYSFIASAEGETYQAVAVWDTNGAEVYIWTGTSWEKAIPYVWLNGTWVQATSKIYQNGDWN